MWNRESYPKTPAPDWGFPHFINQESSRSFDMKLTQERLKEVLRYDAEGTGMFVRATRQRGCRVGEVVGSFDPFGYIKIGVDAKDYLAHRLAWLYVYGYMSENLIDHINRNPADNRISNLREVSQQCNMRNTGTPKHNTSGVKGS